MEFEIAVEGPTPAIKLLSSLLEGVRFQTRSVPSLDGRSSALRSVLIRESSPELVDRRLLELASLIDKVEAETNFRDCLKLRVRNLAYSEPPSGSEDFLEPFNPIPSLTVQPCSSGPDLTFNENVILLDPHNAFGTGKHPSTRLSLDILAGLALRGHGDLSFSEWSVLDFGCGTGILAIAALRLGAKAAVGVEIDGQSVRTALKNVRLNRLSERIRIVQGSWDRAGGQYDLILANVVPSVLFRMGDEIPVHLKKGGLAVVSGFGENLLGEMTQFFSRMGLSILDLFSLEGWGGMLMAHTA